MARFLSPEWIEEMNAELSAGERTPDGGRLVLQQVVTDGPDGDVAYAVEIDGGRVHVTSGRAAAPADQAHITEWLDGWVRYTDIGHRYAAALRNDDLRTQISLSQSGNAVQKATDRFARANDLDDCQFFIKPRGTGSDPFSGGM